MEDQMLAWIQAHGMYVTLQAFRRALIRAMEPTVNVDMRNRMAALANYIGQKV